MKILLLGEYSGVHTNLKDALRDKGHDVFCIHDGDGYKSFTADYHIDYKKLSVKNKFLNKIFSLYYQFLTIIGTKGIIQIFKHKKILNKLSEYDVVQLINPIFLNNFGFIVNFYIFLRLKKNNKKIFLCALGDDYYWVKSSLKGQYKYSMFDNLNIRNIKNYFGQLQWIINPFYIFLNKYIVDNVNGVIPGLYDYYIAYKDNPKCTDIVPIIIPLHHISYLKPCYPIKIFHGWQFGKESRKGNLIIDQVIIKLKAMYPDKIDYQVVGGVPYSIYKQKFNDCHIFIDQCFSYDCGVNALLGMSSAKVVLSGLEKEVKEYYKLDYLPLVNITPNQNELFNSIEDLILHLDKIEEYSHNAYRFISEYHSPNYVLNNYFLIWNNY